MFKDNSQLVIPRKSHIEIGQIYFWTATVNQWIKLLEPDNFKNVIIDSLAYLSRLNKIDVFAFVIMPNHIHIIWRINEMNGKEMPHASFLKFTAHQFKKMLTSTNPNLLVKFAVAADNKKYEFWQADSLAIQLYSEKVARQKLNYIHNNPLAERWLLAKDVFEYHYSSANFYETKNTKFEFLKNLWDVF